MRNRVLAFVVFVALTAVLLQPVRLDASRFGFDPTQPIYAGYLVEDSSCPAATHALKDYCTQRTQVYLVFNRMKAIKRYEKGFPILQGPADTTSCSLPLISVQKIIAPRDVPPPPCGG